jgi:Sigma-70, region 4
MQTVVPSWAQRGCPALPESLRVLWSGETLPAWVSVELGLAKASTFAALGVEAWVGCPHDELPQSIQKFLINVVAMRRASISDLRVFARPWPRSLDPSLLSWSNRTRNCLQKAGLLSDVSRLSMISFGELLSISALGAVSVLDFSCVAEAAFAPSHQVVREGGPGNDDPAALLLEAIDATWSGQISSQDPRFSDLLPTGHLTVFERLEQLTAEPEDPPLAELQLARSLTGVRERLSRISSVPLEVALADFVERLTRYSGARLKALLRRLGFDGEEPATLEEAAALLGVTRERMRQIHKRLTDRLPNHPLFMPQVDAAIYALREAAPIGADRAAVLLQTKGISAHAFHPKSLLAAADFCGRPQPFELENSVGLPRVIVEKRREFERAALSVACRQAEASGATNVQDVAAELVSRGHGDVDYEKVRRLLNDCREIEFLNPDWLWHKAGIPERNRLRNVTRKMLSVTSPIHVGELREGVHRHYKIRRTRGISSWPLVTPPRAVLQEFYRVHPEFSIEQDGLVGSVGKLEYASALNSTERILFEVLRSSPACLLDRTSLARSCADFGMNPNTFSQYLTSSPVITHVGTDMWSLRGTKVDAASVEALREANAARPNEKRIIDHGWTERGELWLAARLPEDPSHFVLGIPSAIRRFVVGREFPATDENGVTAGTVRVNAEGTSYGYRPFLVRGGADADDILLITFQLTAAVSTLRLIDDEELEAISPGA